MATILPSSSPPLIAAAISGDLDFVKKQFQSRANLAEVDGQGRQALHHAAQHGQLGIVEFLLSPEVKMDSNIADSDKRTPLHLAAQNGHVKVVRALLKAHADVRARDSSFGRQPLHCAADGGHAEVIKVLLAHGARPDAQTLHHKTAIELARAGGHETAVKALSGPPLTMPGRGRALTR